MSHKLTGPQVLLGQTAVAVTDLRPEGEVRVGGIIWRATSVSGDVLKGESVRIKKMKGSELTVEKVKEKPLTSPKK